MKVLVDCFCFVEQVGATANDTKLFYGGFDAFEIMNGPDDHETTKHPTMLNDFFSLLSHGITTIGTGNSDTHYNFGRELGWPRNYVALANDAPSAFGGQVEAFAQSVIDGHHYMTSGPQLFVTVNGAGPGDQVTATGSVTVIAQLEMPDWVEVDTLNIYVNTPNTTAPATDDGNPNPPVPTDSSVITLLTTTNGNGTVKRYQTITRTITVPTNGDAWLVVTADSTTGPSLFPVLSFSIPVRPFALASPVYIDGNGDGVWTPPGISSALTSSAHVETVDEFGPRDIRERPEDVREQWERLTSGEHKH